MTSCLFSAETFAGTAFGFWTATTGSGTIGVDTITIDALPGDVLTLGVGVFEAFDGLSGGSVSIEFDPSRILGTSAVECVVCPANYAPAVPGVTIDSVLGTMRSFDAFGPGSAATVVNLGEATWTLASGGSTQLDLGFFDTGTDVLLDRLGNDITPFEAFTVFVNPCGGSLVGYWPFDGDALDHSDCMNDGTVNGAVLGADPVGNIAYAYSFDGVDDFIDFGNSLNLKRSPPVTIAFWVRSRCPLGSTCVLFANDLNDGTVYSGILVGISFSSEGLWFVRLGDGGAPSPNSRQDAIAGAQLSTDVWHHVAAVVRSGTDMDLYLDGNPVAVSYEGNGSGVAYAGGVSAGVGIGPTGSSPFPGEIDDVYVFSRELSQAEIRRVPEATSATMLALGTAALATAVRRSRRSLPPQR
jgi:hypothetical protein